MTLSGVHYRKWRFDMIWESMYGFNHESEDDLIEEDSEEEEFESSNESCFR